MRPSEYYNYPKRNYRLWWLPLVLIPVLAIFGFRGCGGENVTPSTAPTGGQTGVAEQNYHTVLAEGQLWYVLDREYEGDFDLQTVRFLEEPPADGPEGEIPIPLAGGQIPGDFPREAVLDREAYLAYCDTWGLTPAFPDHDGPYAVLARVGEHASRAEVQVADAAAEGSTLRLLVRARFSGAGPDSPGFVLTVPVPASVTALEVVPVCREEEVGQAYDGT